MRIKHDSSDSKVIVQPDTRKTGTITISKQNFYSFTALARFSQPSSDPLHLSNPPTCRLSSTPASEYHSSPVAPYHSAPISRPGLLLSFSYCRFHRRLSHRLRCTSSLPSPPPPLCCLSDFSRALTRTCFFDRRSAARCTADRCTGRSASHGRRR